MALAAAPAQAQVHFGGTLQIDKRFDFGGDSLKLADFYNRLQLKASASLGTRALVRASADWRFYDVPRTSSTADGAAALFPSTFTVWQAYVDLHSFMLDNLDVRAGKQRIAWGVADRVNPTDNLNPEDFTDLLHLGDRLPTWALKADYYVGETQLTAVWLPSFTPALLPPGGTALFFGPALSSTRDSIILPGSKLADGMAAVRVHGAIGRFDYSLSYFDGYDDLPIPTRLTISPGAPAPRLDLAYPRLRVLGGDLATEFAGSAVWAEAGVFFPDSVVTQVDMGGVVGDTVALSRTPYVKFTVGGDHTFPGGFYLNVQWAHGFFTERGQDALHDYALVDARYDVADRVRLELSSALEIAGWDPLMDHIGSALAPEVAYVGIDNLEVAVGAWAVSGASGTLFGAWRDADQAYLRFKASF